MFNNFLQCEHLTEKIKKIPYKLPRQPISEIFYNHRSKSNLGKHAPFTRISIEYDEINKQLPSIGVFSDSLHQFKKHLID